MASNRMISKLITRSLSSQSSKTITPIKLKTYKGTSPLYLHPSTTSTTTSISFLSKPPISLNSPTILGSFSDSSYSKFDSNPAFLQLIHHTFQTIYTSDPYLIDLSKSRQDLGPDGYIHLFDQRQSNSDISHRGGPSAESIIFSFLVNSKTGLPLPETYESNPVYRIWTPNEGFLILPNSLQSSLLHSSELVYQIESEESLND
ncbi:uncharacterized protein MELLADRAFT_109968 [Melampsora larici-populina 98AG31]|uniref:Uncharacterized protein n=1 Tax=Melampsora larici-populina (strain 98AG31 / pathotype 3-4-7) TaxID=747676 RepID=F4RY78_MELLP|nr:uncharacterized protein MELLADRAFT_109968 [Melampsora larici-populina 98AG31]EGG02683.1 hypothetical protein MELLADRAFT_109968 [Melampsora larici-populina 98AG31]